MVIAWPDRLINDVEGAERVAQAHANCSENLKYIKLFRNSLTYSIASQWSPPSQTWFICLAGHWFPSSLNQHLSDMLLFWPSCHHSFTSFPTFEPVVVVGGLVGKIWQSCHMWWSALFTVLHEYFLGYIHNSVFPWFVKDFSAHVWRGLGVLQRKCKAISHHFGPLLLAHLCTQSWKS